QHLTTTGSGRHRSTSLVPAKLDIWVGVQKYQLHGVKSEAELEWLAHELSDWLGIQIERK
ncbi:MAG: serine/threonine protein kinase, partial [Nostoc sp.]